MFPHTLQNVVVASQLVLSENMRLKNFLMIRELYLLKLHTQRGKQNGNWKASFCRDSNEGNKRPGSIS